MKGKAALHNLGCKVNAYELEAMQQLLEADGYEIVPFAPGADVYLINTCTVTNIADRKSRQMLHKAKKMNPEAIVVAAGCYVQSAKDKIEADEAIDLIIGNNQKQNLISLLDAYRNDHKKGRGIIDINKTHEYEELEISQTAEHTRAYIKVQDGCNQFCSYCIIPFARGRVRSRKKDDVVAEVNRLAKMGYREVVLTGIHLSSYGIDFEEETEDLLSLIQAVHQIDGIERIRLGSLEPRIVTEKFAKGIASMPKVCPHFHLSMQSGCDETLERMNRRYDSAEFYEKCQLLREVYKRPALTTDIIVGFPQESEEEFEKSYVFTEKVNFFETHIFKYSMREGTKAAKMSGQISDEEKTKRSHRMITLGKLHQRRYMEQFLGEELEILAEEEIQLDGQHFWVGHSREYLRIAVPCEDNLQNKLVCIKVEKILEDNLLKGSLLKIIK